MTIVSPSAMTSILLAISSIDKFLRYDLTSTLTDGRPVLEPQKDWATVVENCVVLRSFRFFLTDDENERVERLIHNVQTNLNAVVNFFRSLSQLPKEQRQSEDAQLLSEGNALILRTQTSFESDAEALRAALERENKPLLSTPAAIAETLHHFERDHPRPNEAAFLMMRFGTTKAHQDITRAIRAVMDKYRVQVLRADDKQYHDDLFANIQTYMHGCGFGIAVFERIEQDDFNPNVSLEVGYMSALGKPVLLLKDKTLRVLHSDLIGRLYSVFDPLDPDTSIGEGVEKWLRDKGFVASPGTLG
jgi:uncharacterized protein with PIN domain